MKEKRHTGGLMEFSYPKGYKAEWNESDDMRRKSIRQYYEKKALKNEQKENIKNKVLAVLIIVIIIFLLLKFMKIL